MTVTSNRKQKRKKKTNTNSLGPIPKKIVTVEVLSNVLKLNARNQCFTSHHTYFCSSKFGIIMIEYFREFKSLSNTGFSLRKQETFKPFQCAFLRKRMCKREMQLEASYESQYEDVSFSSGTSWSADHGQARWDSSSDHARSVSSQDEEKLYTVFYCIPLISPYKGTLHRIHCINY